jgi:hypothetical protein
MCNLVGDRRMMSFVEGQLAQHLAKEGSSSSTIDGNEPSVIAATTSGEVNMNAMSGSGSAQGSIIRRRTYSFLSSDEELVRDHSGLRHSHLHHHLLQRRHRSVSDADNDNDNDDDDGEDDDDEDDEGDEDDDDDDDDHDDDDVSSSPVFSGNVSDSVQSESLHSVIRNGGSERSSSVALGGGGGRRQLMGRQGRSQYYRRTTSRYNHHSSHHYYHHHHHHRRSRSESESRDFGEGESVREVSLSGGIGSGGGGVGSVNGGADTFGEYEDSEVVKDQRRVRMSGKDLDLDTEADRSESFVDGLVDEHQMRQSSTSGVTSERDEAEGDCLGEGIFGNTMSTTVNFGTMRTKNSSGDLHLLRSLSASSSRDGVRRSGLGSGIDGGEGVLTDRPSKRNSGRLLERALASREVCCKNYSEACLKYPIFYFVIYRDQPLGR